VKDLRTPGKPKASLGRAILACLVNGEPVTALVSWVQIPPPAFYFSKLENGSKQIASSLQTGFDKGSDISRGRWK